MLLIFLAPLVYWYITVPEIIYMIYAMIRSAGNNGPVTIYGIWLALYFCGFVGNHVVTMVLTAVLIFIDFLIHRRLNADR